MTERCAVNFDEQAPSASNAALFPGFPNPVTLNVAVSSRPTPVEQTQSAEDCRIDSAAAERHPSSQSLRSCKGFPQHADTRDDVPAAKSWVISNRKVQKRYRERQKAEKVSMEQQLEKLTAQLQHMTADNAELAGHNTTLEKAVVFKDHEVSQLQERSHAMDTTSTAASAASVSLNCRGEPSVKRAGQPNVIQTYKGIVKAMVGLMLRLSHEGLTPALTQELEGAACALIVLFMRTFIFSAHDGARLMKADLEHDHYQAAALHGPQEDPKHLWQTVTDRLELRSEQKQEMANLRKHFLQSLNECHEAREGICSGLQQGTQKIQTAYTTIDTDAQAYIASMLELHHESKQLRENLRKQHRIWMDFYATIFRLWDARQTCCAAVHSFPRFPDLLAISSCVAIADAPQDVAGDRSFRTHKVEMKRSPRFTHRLLAST
ncbi:hypothetical protein WJX77_000929 [Trebouxia sp. C0004]